MSAEQNGKPDQGSQGTPHKFKITKEELADHAAMVLEDAAGMHKVAYREARDWMEQIAILSNTLNEAFNGVDITSDSLLSAPSPTPEQKRSAGVSMHIMIRTIAASALALSPICEEIENQFTVRRIVTRSN